MNIKFYYKKENDTTPFNLCEVFIKLSDSIKIFKQKISTKIGISSINQVVIIKGIKIEDEKKRLVDIMNPKEWIFYYNPNFIYVTKNRNFITSNKIKSNNIFYKWLIDILPYSLLKKYKVKKYGIFLKPWESIISSLSCRKVIKKGMFGKYFYDCECEKFMKTYFISTVNMGMVSKLDDLIIDNPTKEMIFIKRKFFLFIKEILISMKLNLLSSYMIKKQNQKFPICRNFVETFYVSSYIENNDMFYGVVQEKLDYTLYDFIQKFKEKPKFLKKKKKRTVKKKEIQRTINDFIPIYFQLIYGLLCADMLMKFRHSDLHSQNVMISEIKDEDFNGFTFYINDNLIYQFPKSFNLLVKIIDFNRSNIIKPQDHKKNPDPKVVKLLDDLFNTLTGYWLFVEKIKEKHFKKLDMKTLHHDGVSDFLDIGDKELFKKFTDKTLQDRNDYYLILLKDPEFLKYRVKKKNIDFNKLNPKYTFVFEQPDEKYIVDTMYMNPNFKIC